VVRGNTRRRVNFSECAKTSSASVTIDIGFDTILHLIVVREQSQNIAQAWTRVRAWTLTRRGRPGSHVRLCCDETPAHALRFILPRLVERQSEIAARPPVLATPGRQVPGHVKYVENKPILSRRWCYPNINGLTTSIEKR